MVATPGGIAGFSAVDAVDMAASSIPGVRNVTGLQRGELSNDLLGLIDKPGWNAFYNENRGAIEVGSGVVGLIASEAIARKITAPAGAAMKFFKGTPYIGRIATLDNEYRASLMTLRSVDSALARRGAMNVEQYMGSATARQFLANDIGPDDVER